MKFAVLALDYDGTIAEGGVLHPDVRAAVAEVRDRGVTVVIVTGRRLAEVRALIGDPGLVDAIVAENGAVLAFPHDDASRVLGPPPPEPFLAALGERGITWARGECVVEAAAADAHALLSLIREHEAPLVLVFNRSRVMVLPQGISKATGLRAALEALRLSEHNAIGIGDAENDHALLQACEVGVAVTWGSRSLVQAADEVLPGAGPEAVAGYIREAARHERLAPERTGRRRLLLGYLADGSRLELHVRGRNVLVAGDPRTGKSWVAGLLCEQLILQRYSLCVIDPEGDYRTLQALPGVVTLGGDDPPPAPSDLLRALRHPDVSVVIDLSRVALRDKQEYVAGVLPLLASLRHQHGVPHRIILDEAHHFLAQPGALAQLDLDLAGYTFVTYRVSLLPPEVLASTEAVIVTRLAAGEELDILAATYCLDRGQTMADRLGAGAAPEAPANGSAAPAGAGGMEAGGWRHLVANLALHEAVLLPRAAEASGRLCRFHVARRMTPHARHREKYRDVPVPESRAFVFTRHGRPTGQRARTLTELAGIIEHGDPEALDGHLRRGDFSRWIGDSMRDRSLAAHLRDLEQQYAQHPMPVAEVRLLLLQTLHE